MLVNRMRTLSQKKSRADKDDKTHKTQPEQGIQGIEFTCFASSRINETYVLDHKAFDGFSTCFSHTPRKFGSGNDVGHRSLPSSPYLATYWPPTRGGVPRNTHANFQKSRLKTKRKRGIQSDNLKYKTWTEKREMRHADKWAFSS
jgi:hypothetical protein